MNYINNTANINETFIIEPAEITGGTSISACTAVFTNLILSCDDTTEIILGNNEIDVNQSIVPVADSTIDLGSTVKRFRQINTLSGNTTYWTATNATVTTLSANTIDLGYDSDGNHRVLTANSVILNMDELEGGHY